MNIDIPTRKDIKLLVEIEVKKRTAYLEKLIDYLQSKIVVLEEEMRIVLD